MNPSLLPDLAKYNRFWALLSCVQESISAIRPRKQGCASLVGIVCGLLLFSVTVNAYEDKVSRYALVVGNKNYQTAPLRNAINDANSMSSRLEKLGFKVTLLRDATASDLTTGVEDFYRTVQRSTAGKALAVFYYAGHAVQIDNRNYLVPLDVTFASSTETEFIASLFDINDLFAQIPILKDSQNIIILDACRNNPFTGEGKEFSNRIGDGLAPLRAPAGTLIAYATEPGSVAADGKGKNGVYTKHLLRHMAKKISVEEVFKKVRSGVAKETSKRQIPWEHSSLMGDVFINPPPNREVPDLMTF